MNGVYGNGSPTHNPFPSSRLPMRPTRTRLWVRCGGARPRRIKGVGSSLKPSRRSRSWLPLERNTSHRRSGTFALLRRRKSQRQRGDVNLNNVYERPSRYPWSAHFFGYYIPSMEAHTSRHLSTFILIYVHIYRPKRHSSRNKLIISLLSTVRSTRYLLGGLNTKCSESCAGVRRFPHLARSASRCPTDKNRSARYSRARLPRAPWWSRRQRSP